MSYAPLIEALDVLRWVTPNRAPWTWMAALSEKLHDRMELLCAQLVNEDPLLVNALALLPGPARTRMLRAPSVSDLLLRADGPLWSRSILADATLAEFAQEGHDGFLVRPVWSAHGDAQYGLPQEKHGWQPLPVRLDWRSPFLIPHVERGGNSFTHLDPQELEVALTQIADAFRALEEVNGHASALVREFTEVLVLRREATESSSFHSGTFDRYIGLVLLTNPQISLTRERLVDALVHETIHNVLFNFEGAIRSFLPQQEMPEFPQMRSPWTGADLRLPSFVHACVVWYGLYWFWTMVERSSRSLFNPVNCRQLLVRSLRGFLAGPTSRVVSAHASLLSEEIKGLLRGIEDVMAGEIVMRRGLLEAEDRGPFPTA